jgi:hypothetical protein
VAELLKDILEMEQTDVWFYFIRKRTGRRIS